MTEDLIKCHELKPGMSFLDDGKRWTVDRLATSEDRFNFDGVTDWLNQRANGWMCRNETGAERFVCFDVVMTQAQMDWRTT